MNKHWIKAWISDLDAHNLARLDDKCWRFAWECALVAGEQGDNEGWLPGPADLGWRLRRDTKEVERLLAQLEGVGITKSYRRRGHVKWKLPNFKKQQAAVPARDRKRAQRSDNGRYSESITAKEIFS
jgi:hypothetical protein